MGICSSTNSDNQVIDEINEHSDYEKAREDIKRRGDEDIYEVKAKLYEYVKVNTRLTRKSLVSKYCTRCPMHELLCMCIS